MKLEKVASTGATRTLAFVDYADRSGEMKEVDLLVYPPHPQGDRLREARVQVSVSMGELAKVLGITAAELSGLEHGSYTTDQAGWDECWTALYELREKKWASRGNV